MPSRKAAPVEYVRICDSYGTGFYWIPGTDTCLKVGGRVRYDMSYVPSKNAVAHRSTTGNGIVAGNFISANAVDTIGDNLRASVTMDSRTQTAWGTLQTAFSIRVSGLSGIMNAPPGYRTASLLPATARAVALNSPISASRVSRLVSR